MSYYPDPNAASVAYASDPNAAYYYGYQAADYSYAGYTDYSGGAAAQSSYYDGGARGGPMRSDHGGGGRAGAAPYPAIDPKAAFTAAFGREERKPKNKVAVRVAGGKVWEDPTLNDEWDPNDFRIFCGDLGNETTDETLRSAFSKYPSFQKARVVRDKKTNKSKGYGFVSFKDPNDYMAAMKEMNGKFVGSRPIKLRKSNWQERSVAPKQLKKVLESDVMKLASQAEKFNKGGSKKGSK
ncbi:hypothetical protein DFJ74DRAFT_684484 [Hyaloraphidium curvatum]|nr:hypothetical protein DFJ74DRAFT_684484 [Hyaloraphidium curvatum]